MLINPLCKIIGTLLGDIGFRLFMTAAYFFLLLEVSRKRLSWSPISQEVITEKSFASNWWIVVYRLTHPLNTTKSAQAACFTDSKVSWVSHWAETNKYFRSLSFFSSSFIVQTSWATLIVGHECFFRLEVWDFAYIYMYGAHLLDPVGGIHRLLSDRIRVGICATVLSDAFWGQTLKKSWSLLWNIVWYWHGKIRSKYVWSHWSQILVTKTLYFNQR